MRLQEGLLKRRYIKCSLSAGQSKKQCSTARAEQHSQVQSASAGPDISCLSPRLHREWMHDRNQHLGSIVVTPGSRRKVWWSCPDCPDGHSHIWEAAVSARMAGSGCPFCSGRKVCKHNSLATKAPAAALDWHRDRNLPLSPETVTAQSSYRAHWCCSACQHEWRAWVAERVRCGCLKCANAHAGYSKDGIRQKHPSFASCKHSLLSEWDHVLNAMVGNYPDNITLGSGKRIWWVCNKCPKGKNHSWQARPRDRIRKVPSNCPYCAGSRVCACNSLQDNHPDIADDFDVNANGLTAAEVTSSSNKKFRWRSDVPDAPLRSVNQRTYTARMKARHVSQM